MNKKQEIIKLLGEYKYLTIDQLLDIGVKSYDRTQKDLLILRREELIGVIKYAGRDIDKFKAQDIHYLKKPAALTLKARGWRFQHPTKMINRMLVDFRHRFYTTNVQISFSKWVKNNGYKIEEFTTYFSSSDEFSPATKLILPTVQIVPDFVALLSGAKTLRFVGELTNGINTGEAIEKINQLKLCAKENLFTQYGWDKLPRVLCIMETENLKRLTIKRFNNEPDLQPYAPMFLFSTIHEVVEDFDNWVNTKGEMIKLSEL